MALVYLGAGTGYVLGMRALKARGVRKATAAR
jgi:hypothetical protein